MQETKNSSWYSTVAGALFALGGVMELFQWLSVFRFMSFGGHVQMLIWVASYAVLAFALLTKRRDIFLPVGFALAGIACLFSLNFRSVLLLPLLPPPSAHIHRPDIRLPGISAPPDHRSAAHQWSCDLTGRTALSE